MTDKKKRDPEEKKKKSDKKEKKLNEGLRQSFPASDPPSHSRPGHDRNDKNK